MRAEAHNIFLSTGAFRSQHLEKIFEMCDMLDFHNLELSSGVPWSPNLHHDVLQVQEKYRFLVHNYFPPTEKPFVLNLAAKNIGILKRSIDHCKGAMQLCADLRAPFYSVHSGFAFDADPSRLGKKLSDVSRYPLVEATKIFVHSLRELSDFGRHLGITILIENNVIAPMNLIDGKNLLLLGATAENMLEIYERVRFENFGFMIDLGHLKVTANSLRFDPVQFLHEVKDHIVAFHLNDNDGLLDTNALYNEHSWFVPEMKNYPDQIRIVESYALSLEQLRQIIAYTRNL